MPIYCDSVEVPHQNIVIRTGRSPIKFILPEFVSYLGERGVLWVGNGWHFCTPVLMNMANITLEGPRLSTFVFKKSSEKKDIHDYNYSWLRA